MDKREYYIRSAIVEDYERLRYAGPGGIYANERELELALRLVPQQGVVLDLPVGTGRLSERIIKRGGKVISLDYSATMLTESRKLQRIKAPVRGDAFNLPFADNSLDCVASLRFVFHYADLEKYLREMQRVLKPGGSVVFDTYTWSPFMFSFTPAACGGQSFIHRSAQVRKLAASCGLHVEMQEGAFLCSPLIYRFARGPLLKLLIFAENKLSPGLRNVQFWKLTKHV